MGSVHVASRSFSFFFFFLSLITSFLEQGLQLQKPTKLRPRPTSPFCPTSFSFPISFSLSNSLSLTQPISLSLLSPRHRHGTYVISTSAASMAALAGGKGSEEAERWMAAPQPLRCGQGQRSTARGEPQFPGVVPPSPATLGDIPSLQEVPFAPMIVMVASVPKESG